jgi:homoserine kinase
VRLTATVPATVANLGPGFDCLALAVDVGNEISIDTEASPGVAVEGEGAAELPADETNLVVRSMARLALDSGKEMPPLSIRCRNGIPLERGLGSSAAAVIGGLALADRLLEAHLSPQALLEMAESLEGHVDNAAAALYGGLALTYREAGAGWRVERLRPVPRLRPVLLVPESERVSTEAARRALPAQVPLDSAAFNAARTALLVVALTTSPHLLREALRDRLHQGSRLRLAPATDALFRRLVLAGVPTCVAGSGPALLAFEDDATSVPDPGPGWRVLRTRIDPRGVQIEEG